MTTEPKVYNAEILPDGHWWVRGRCQALFEHLKAAIPPEGPALDVGAGTGQWGSLQATRWTPTIALEPDVLLRSMAASRPLLTGNVCAGSVQQHLPFRDAAFRFVSCLDVLEHLDDDSGAMRELVRVTRPGGHVLISVPAEPALWSPMDDRVGHKRRYTEQAIHDLVAASGLALRLLSPFNVYLFPLARLARRLGLSGEGVPPAPINAFLAKIFALEGARLGRMGKRRRGLSWVVLAQRSG